jgi:predicted nucleotidyltransferase
MVTDFGYQTLNGRMISGKELAWWRITKCGRIPPMKRNEAIEKLKSQSDAIRALGATSLYLFGSVARNEAGPASDLDLFIDYDPQSRFSAFDLVGIKLFLEEELALDVDITTRDSLHPLLRDRIEASATQVF